PAFRKDRHGHRVGTDRRFPRGTTHPRAGLARPALQARSDHQVRLRDLDGRALRREGMERHARSMDPHPQGRGALDPGGIPRSAARGRILSDPILNSREEEASWPQYRYIPRWTTASRPAPPISRAEPWSATAPTSR